MTLPDVCPKDGVSQCKKKACHLYVVEWRTGDEQCVIGYSSTHKQFSKSTPMEDTYAAKVRSRTEQKPERQKSSWPESTTTETRRKHLKREMPEPQPEEVYIEARPGAVKQAVREEPATSERLEEVVVVDKDTTIIESRSGDEVRGKESRKRKSLDEVMDMDLPEDYEKEFWE